MSLGRTGMSSVDILSMALHNLLKRKLRTALTMLGVLIGTAAIVVMISLGIGINQRFEEQLKMYTDLQTIQVYYYGDSMPVEEGGGMPVEAQPLTDEAIEQIRQIKGVQAASPILEISGPTLKTGKYSCEWLQIRGVSDDFIEQFGYKLQWGEGFAQDDTGYSMIMGPQVLMQFYNLKLRNYYMYPATDIDPMSDKFAISIPGAWDESKEAKKFRDIKVTVAGMFEEGNYNTDYYVYMPIEQVKELKAQREKYEQQSNNGGGGGVIVYSSGSKASGSGSAEEDSYQQVLVRAKRLEDITGIIEQIKEMGYEAWGEGEYVSGMQETRNNMQMLLGSIGGVALLVAAIGIANTMMMAIYERTKEIGIMKVIGAAIRDIKRLFLTEAAFIGLIGGMAGIGVSYAVSAIINHVGLSFSESDQYMETVGDASVIPLWLCLAALVFSTFIGILSGYLPARRAMKVSALTAIRTE